MAKLTVCQLSSRDKVPYSPKAVIVIGKESEADDTLPAASVAVAVSE